MKGSKMILGLFLILLGVSMVLNTLFKIDFPLMRMFFACLIVYWGVKVLIGPSKLEINTDTPNAALFSSKTFRHQDGAQEYSVVFSKGRVDLTKVDLSKGDVEVEVNTVFGDTQIEIGKDTPFVIEAKSVFAESRMPDENLNILGSVRYRTEDAKNAPHLLKIKVHTVFGSFKVLRQGS